MQRGDQVVGNSNLNIRKEVQISKIDLEIFA